MMNKNNAYFEELKRIGHEWEAARIERKARKQQIIDTLGWESDELKAWYEEDAAAKFPFEQGVSKAYRAWATSISRKEDELEMDDFLWEREVTDFVETLRKAGIKTFVYTNQSTAGKPLGRRGADQGYGHPLLLGLREVPHELRRQDGAGSKAHGTPCQLDGAARPDPLRPAAK